MAKITQVNNGDTGLQARTKINEAIKDVEIGAEFSGSGIVGSVLIFLGRIYNVARTLYALFDAGGLTAIRTLTIQDKNITIAGLADIRDMVLITGTAEMTKGKWHLITGSSYTASLPDNITTEGVVNVYSLGSSITIDDPDANNINATNVGGSTGLTFTPVIRTPYLFIWDSIESEWLVYYASDRGPSRVTKALTVVTNVINLNWDNKTQLVAKNVLAVSANASLSVSNVPSNAECNFWLNISNLATINCNFLTTVYAQETDTRWDGSTRVFTPDENGIYEIVITKVGSDYFIKFSDKMVNV